MNVWDAQYAAGQYRRWPNEMLISFVGGLGKTGRLRCLDIGCGAGANSWFLASLGHEVVGLDASPAAIVCAKRLRDKVGLIWGIRHHDLTIGLPFSDDTFDLVVDVTCLQHLTEAEHGNFLIEVARVLRPSGSFWSYRLVHGTDYAAVFPGAPPVWLPTPLELGWQYSRSGFTVTFLEHNRQYRRGWAKYLMAEARRCA